MTATRHANRNMPYFQRNYHIVEKLRTGGMGRVYLAIMRGPLNTTQKVVLKLPLSLRDSINYLRDFENEARVMAQLNHPNIIRSIEWTQLNGIPCMVTEYIEGFELRDIIRTYNSRNQSIPLTIVAQIMMQACDAMQYVHTAKTVDGSPLRIVHRDIDASNIMISDDGFVKVIDFGIATNSMRETVTEPDVYKGKLVNLPPEIFEHNQVDHRADIFSLGIMLFEMLTGRRPRQFNGTDSITRIIEVIKTREIPVPSEVAPHIPDIFDQIVLKATSHNREDRYQSAAEMFNDLRSFSRALVDGPNYMSIRKWAWTDLGSLRRERDARISDALANPTHMPDVFGTAGMRVRRYNHVWKWQNTLKNRLEATKLQLKQWRINLTSPSMFKAASLVGIFAVFALAFVFSVILNDTSIHPDGPVAQIETVTDLILIDKLPNTAGTASVEVNQASDAVNAKHGLDSFQQQKPADSCPLFTPHIQANR